MSKINLVDHRVYLLSQNQVFKMDGYFGQNQPSRFLRILYYIPNFIKLFWRLFRDPRIRFYIKLIPIIGAILSLSYIIVPFDMIPDLLAFIGQLDDLTVTLFFMIPSIWIFIRSCPKEIVKEHAQGIGGGSLS